MLGWNQVWKLPWHHKEPRPYWVISVESLSVLVCVFNAEEQVSLDSQTASNFIQDFVFVSPRHLKSYSELKANSLPSLPCYSSSDSPILLMNITTTVTNQARDLGEIASPLSSTPWSTRQHMPMILSTTWYSSLSPFFSSNILSKLMPLNSTNYFLLKEIRQIIMRYCFSIWSWNFIKSL